jgi:DNA-directed RNA polymerase specialized sigma24 family protein
VKVLGQRSEVLDLYQPQIRWVSESVAASFGGRAEAEDLWQEAAMLVLSYFGELKWRHYGKHVTWEKRTGGDQAQIRKLLATTLRHDLTDVAAARLRKEPSTTPIDLLPEDALCDDSFEEGMADQLDGRELRKRYPTLVRQHLYGYSQQEIADHDHVTLSAVEKRVVREKAQLAADYGMTQDDFGLAA